MNFAVRMTHIDGFANLLAVQVILLRRIETFVHYLKFATLIIAGGENCAIS